MLLYPLLSFVITLLTTPLVIRLARRFDLVTDIKRHLHPAHTHTGIVPRGGGLPIFVGLFIPLIYFIAVNKIVLFLFLGALVTVVVGLLDDKYNLSPYIRFVLNIVVAGLAVAGGIGIPFITNPFDTVFQLDQWYFTLTVGSWHAQVLWVANIAAVLWIVWCMNMVNWSKGVDGQLPGFVVIAAFFLGILALRFTRHDIAAPTVALVSFATAGAFLGFLPWNFYPQKILPGYGAGSLAGYMLATLSILSWGKLGTLLLVIALPFTDAGIVMVRRLMSKRSPFRGDRGHFHHILLDIGWGRRRIAVFYWIVSFIVGGASLAMSREKKFFALILLVAVFIAMIMWSVRFAQQLKTSSKSNEV